ncbi:MAG TPA: LysR family transcriptional regulator [Gammaproteobacteria bacterium]|nr:LysR family transcriptional regulator [Gammaproteobacteria bacterium]
MSSTVYYKQNRLKQLRAFCRVVQSGSISQAAEGLFLSQPTVTLQIQALERDMDIHLFERRGPQIELTPHGEVLYRLAQPLVEGMDNLEDSFHAHLGNLESGELNIAAGESTILYILPALMKQFARTYPGIRLKLHNVTGRDGMAMLRADEADIAVGSMIDVPEDMVYQPMVDYSPYLITPHGHSLAEKRTPSLEDISHYGLILPPRHLATWRIVELVFSQRGLEFNVSLEAGGWEVIKKYVEIGMGISIVTGVCLTGEENLEFRTLEQYFPNRSYGLVMRKGKFLTPQAECFIGMMDERYSFEGEIRADSIT